MDNLAGRNTGRMWYGNGKICNVATDGHWKVWPEYLTRGTISVRDSIQLVLNP